MSFCSDVKNEICNHKLNKRCCRRSECEGLMLGIKKKKDTTLTFKTGCQSVAEHAFHIFDKSCFKCSIVENDGQRYDVVSLQKGIELELPTKEYDSNCCRSAYVRGAFLACGQLSNPGRSYRIDFNLCNEETALHLQKILVAAGFEPRISVKSNGKATVYIKNSTQVEDLMTYMGAPLSTLDLMEVRVEKDYKNHINRAVNFETANYVRSFDVGEEQALAIEKLQREGLFDNLSDDLKSTALARLEYRDASLSVLAQVLGISRASVNRRLKKIIQLSENI